MNKSITYYNQLSILALLIFFVLVSLQVVWVVKAVKFQEKEVIHNLKEVVADVAIEVNGLKHEAFHGSLEKMSDIPTEIIAKKIDGYLQSKGFIYKTYFAIFQDSIGGVFKTNGDEYRERFLESDVRACMSCILSFSTLSKEGAEKLDRGEDLRDSLDVLSTFQYYSPVKKMKESKENILWLSLYQPNTLSVAIKALLYLFVANVLLLLLLLGLIYYLLKSLSQHKRFSKIKNDFFNNMTHEFKTPLSSIHLASKVLRQTKDAEKKIVFHQLIEKESKSLEYQIDKLLELSLLDNREITIDKEPINMCALIQEVPIKLRLLIEDKLGKLTIDCEVENTFIEGDYYHLFSSLCNLVENSLKYSSIGVKITIKIVLEGETIKIIVNDNGPGIKEEHRANIFSRFYRGQTNNKYKGKGFGIGLSYVKSIIEAHQGQIILNTDYHKGTEFIIQLPIIEN